MFSAIAAISIALFFSRMVLKPSFVAILASLASVEVANAWFRYAPVALEVVKCNVD